MFTKTLKQLWEELKIKAEAIGTDLESEEMKLLGALAERCHKIEVELGFVIDDSAPHEPAPGDFVKYEKRFPTATDQAIAAAGDAAPDTGAADPAANNVSDAEKLTMLQESFTPDTKTGWDGHRHI